MDIQIIPQKLQGTVTPPPSKSQAHRFLIAAALAEGTSTIQNVAFSQDIQATLRCMEALGAEWFRQSADTICVSGIRNFSHPEGELPHFDCGESGSTLRFLIPIALAAAGGGVFTGRGRLMERPQKPYFDIFNERDIFYEQKNGVLTVRGRLTPGEYHLPGNVSSQFFTGLLFALSLLDGPSTIVGTTALESADYITMTIHAMGRAGVTAAEQWGQRRFSLLPAPYRAFCEAVEADWSQAGFWYAAMSLGNPVEVTGLDANSVQGDRVIGDHFVRLARLGDLAIDVSGCPDLVPPLAVMAAVRNGTASLVNASRLRIKESDRLASVSQTLNALGADVEEGPDFLKIRGRDSLDGGVCVDCCNDHRIAMMAAIAATRCQKPVTLLGAECVKKSYPDFWEVYQALGGVVYVL